MKRNHAFTLIELLIVVAIIAILAAIAVPNFLEAQVRSKVSRVRADHRSLATAIESYYVDNNRYPAMALILQQTPDSGLTTVDPTGRTFRLRTPVSQLNTITSPIAYVTTYFPDPFNDVRGATFRYFEDGRGWILGSYGPDTDSAGGGDLLWNGGTIEFDRSAPISGRGWRLGNADSGVESAYVGAIAQPSPFLLVGATPAGAYTYDPTNGTVSNGDVWRVRD